MSSLSTSVGTDPLSYPTSIIHACSTPQRPVLTPSLHSLTPHPPPLPTLTLSTQSAPTPLSLAPPRYADGVPVFKENTRHRRGDGRHSRHGVVTSGKGGHQYEGIEKSKRGYEYDGLDIQGVDIKPSPRGGSPQCLSLALALVPTSPLSFSSLRYTP